MTEPTLFQGSSEPLAARMRPKTLEQFLGQEHLLGPGKALGDLIRRGAVPNVSASGRSAASRRPHSSPTLIAAGGGPSPRNSPRFASKYRAIVP